MQNTKQFTVTFDSPDANQHFSSDNLASLMLSYLTVSDFLYTYAFRYPRLGQDLQRNHGVDTSSQGFAIDFAGENGWFALIETVVIMGASIGNALSTYRSMKKTKDRNSYKDMFAKLQDKRISNFALADFNRALVLALQYDQELAKKYTSIKVVEKRSGDNKVIGWTVTVVEKAILNKAKTDILKDSGNRLLKIADTTSNSIGMVSFAYWIVYIAVGCVTTVFDIGVSGVTPWLGFGLPLAFGLAFGAYKLFNYIRHNKAHRETRNEFNYLTEQLEIEREANNGAYKAPAQLEQDDAQAAAAAPSVAPKDKSHRNLSKSSIATAGVFGLISTYIGWQYNFWYISDVLFKVFDVALSGASQAIGIGIAVTAVLAGVRSIYDAYQEYKKRPFENKETGFFMSFLHDLKPNWKKDELNQRQARVKELEANIASYGDLKTDSPIIDARLAQIRHFEEKSKTNNGLQKIRDFFHITNFGMSAIFVLRTIFVKGTTSFLLPGLTSAVLLSNPVTITLFVVLGLAWGAWKFYHYRKNKNIEKIDQADQHIELLEKKIQVLQNAEKNALKHSLSQVRDASDSFSSPLQSSISLDAANDQGGRSDVLIVDAALSP